MLRALFDGDGMRRLLILVAVSLATAMVVTEYGGVPSDSLRAGDVAPRTVKAPFSFTYQDFEEYETSRKRAGSSVAPVFLYDVGSLTELTTRVAAAFRVGREAFISVDPDEPVVLDDKASDIVVEDFLRELQAPVAGHVLEKLVELEFPPEAERHAIRWLREGLEGAYVLDNRSQLPAAGRPIRVVPRVGDREAFLLNDLDDLQNPIEVRRSVKLTALSESREAPWGTAVERLVTDLIQPNLIFDETRTEKARAEAEAAVPMDPIPVKRGEILFRQGDVLHGAQVAMYEALQASRDDRKTVLGVIAITIFLSLVLGSLYGSTKAMVPGFQDAPRDIAAVGMLLVLTAVMARLIVTASSGVAMFVGSEAQPGSIWFLTPVAGGAILVRVLLGSTWTSLFLIAAASVCGLIMELEAMYVVYFVVTSLVAAGSITQTRERFSLIRAGFTSGVYGALLVLLMHFIELYVGPGELSLATTIRPFWSMIFAICGGLLSGFMALALIPLFEALGFVTDYRMMELASLNHPMMRNLMLRAPGTYHHSVIVGTLAEAACEAIGANSLQAKIAAYFHDIGKVTKPQYFIENQQGGPNRHDSLDPDSSAQTIISHVTEGARLAKEYGLPKPIIDNIYMHHGTGLLQYFFAKAQMEADDPKTVLESRFRYPGPKPSTREAGVIMLADKVEAATRTIRSPNEENIRAMINRIINSVMSDNQFSDCPLTFREIYTIADTFVAVLLGIYHHRIEYPQTASISQRSKNEPEEVEMPVPAPQALPADGTGTITLEFETGARVQERSEVWATPETPSEGADYESVINLPQGKP